MPIVMQGGTGANRGFTLVEMSIVLVIIGLIIGGILKGQEVIASARSKAVINQVNAVRAAANTYFDRYRALPGDDTEGTTVSANLVVGDGNGIVGTTTLALRADAVAEDGSGGENFQYFNALLATNLLTGGVVSNGASATAFGDSALIASPITGAGMTVVYAQMPPIGGTAETKTGHWLRVHKGAASPSGAMSARTLSGIDNQVDDGRGGGGGVQGGNGVGTCVVAATGNYAGTDDLTCVALFEQ